MGDYEAGTPVSVESSLGYHPCSTGTLTIGHESGLGLSLIHIYRRLSNSECRILILGSQTVGDKIHSQKGNSPDRQLRSLNAVSYTHLDVYKRQL